MALGPLALIQALTVESAGAALVGESRAKEIAVNAVLPVLAAVPGTGTGAGRQAEDAYAVFPALGSNTLLREALMLVGGRRGLRLGACEQLGLQRFYLEAVDSNSGLDG